MIPQTDYTTGWCRSELFRHTFRPLPLQVFVFFLLQLHPAAQIGYFLQSRICTAA